MADAARFVSLIKEASKQPDNETVDFVYGTVTKISPLEITTDKFVLTKDFLIASPFAWDSSIPSSTPDDCRVGRALKKDDKVLMLKCGKGQKYYILHRVN